MNQLPPMTLLDYRVSSKELNILKVMLPFVDIHFQPMLAMFIKYSELRATIDLFQHNPYVFGSESGTNSSSNSSSSSCSCSNQPDFSDIISSMLPYLSEEERESMENMQNIINTMNMFEMYKDAFSPDMMSGFEDLGNLDGLGDLGDSDSSDSSDDSGDFVSILQQLSGLM